MIDSLSLCLSLAQRNCVPSASNRELLVWRKAKTPGGPHVHGHVRAVQGPVHEIVAVSLCVLYVQVPEGVSEIMRRVQVDATDAVLRDQASRAEQHSS
jgi:hypothetical protein